MNNERLVVFIRDIKEKVSADIKLNNVFLLACVIEFNYLKYHNKSYFDVDSFAELYQSIVENWNSSKSYDRDRHLSYESYFEFLNIDISDEVVEKIKNIDPSVVRMGIDMNFIITPEMVKYFIEN